MIFMLVWPGINLIKLQHPFPEDFKGREQSETNGFRFLMKPRLQPPHTVR